MASPFNDKARAMMLKVLAAIAQRRVTATNGLSRREPSYMIPETRLG
jgi:hypothetical protein